MVLPKQMRARVLLLSVGVAALSISLLWGYQMWVARNHRAAVANIRAQLGFDVCHMRSLDVLAIERARAILQPLDPRAFSLETRVVSVLEDIRKRDFILAEGELTALSEAGASNGLVRLLSAYRNMELRRVASVLSDTAVASDLRVPEIDGGQLALLSLRLDAALASGDAQLAGRTLREIENRFADTNQCPALSFRRAQVAEAEGDARAAHEELQQVVAQDASDVAAWIKLAQMDELLDLTVDARTHYMQALRLAESNALAHASFALFLAKQRDTDNAAAHASRATELDPNLAVAWAARGEVARIHSDFGIAVEHLRAAYEREPEDATFAFKLAMAYAGANDWLHASEYFERATELRPTLAAAHNGKGVARMQLSQSDVSARAENLALARAAFERAQQLDPNDPNPGRNLLRLHAMTHQNG